MIDCIVSLGFGARDPSLRLVLGMTLFLHDIGDLEKLKAPTRYWHQYETYEYKNTSHRMSFCHHVEIKFVMNNQTPFHNLPLLSICLGNSFK